MLRVLLLLLQAFLKSHLCLSNQVTHACSELYMTRITALCTDLLDNEMELYKILILQNTIITIERIF